jgi:uncharacterized protein YciI
VAVRDPLAVRRGVHRERIRGGERRHAGAHFAYLKAALEAGRLVLAGPATDGLFPGVIVFEAEDEDEARAFLESDPSVRAGVMLAELHPFRVSLLRGRPT